MMPGVARSIQYLGFGGLLLAYPALAHYATLTAASGLAVALAVFPFAAIALGVAWRSPRRTSMLALCGLGFALLAGVWSRLQQNFGWLYFFQHAGTNLALCLLFGRTLLNGRQALCSRLAARLHGSLSPGRARYTRQVTVAWTAFFALMAGISAGLFWLAPMAAWSVFANLLTPLLVALMFAAEYAARRRVLSGERHASLFASARTFWHSPPAPVDPSEHRP